MNNDVYEPEGEKSSRELRRALHEIYKSLIQQERREYERLHGEQSEDDFIQVLTYADSLKWLDGLARLIVLLDLFDDANEYSPSASRVVARKVKGMIDSEGPGDVGFATHYKRHADASQEFEAAHEALLEVLNRFG